MFLTCVLIDLLYALAYSFISLYIPTYSHVDIPIFPYKSLSRRSEDAVEDSGLRLAQHMFLQME